MGWEDHTIMTPLQIAMLDLLTAALIRVRSAARKGDVATCHTVSDAVHNVPQVVRDGDLDAVQRILEVDLQPMAHEVPELRRAIIGVSVELQRERQRSQE